MLIRAKNALKNGLVLAEWKKLFIKSCKFADQLDVLAICVGWIGYMKYLMMYLCILHALTIKYKISECMIYQHHLQWIKRVFNILVLM